MFKRTLSARAGVISLTLLIGAVTALAPLLP